MFFSWVYNGKFYREKITVIFFIMVPILSYVLKLHLGFFYFGIAGWVESKPIEEVNCSLPSISSEYQVNKGIIYENMQYLREC